MNRVYQNVVENASSMIILQKRYKYYMYNCTHTRAAPFYVGWSPAPVCTLQTLDMLKMTILTILKFTTLK